ncbi:hypothetical protein BGY98DRAFT_615557 [Russula aff. rugulosa BPL654]|nr:hypothetical protein BGY98DRAFT_615557 [Russula aff. rugulosa BPL654]
MFRRQSRTVLRSRSGGKSMKEHHSEMIQQVEKPLTNGRHSQQRQTKLPGRVRGISDSFPIGNRSDVSSGII